MFWKESHGGWRNHAWNGLDRGGWSFQQAAAPGAEMRKLLGLGSSRWAGLFREGGRNLRNRALVSAHLALGATTCKMWTVTAHVYRARTLCQVLVSALQSFVLIKGVERLLFRDRKTEATVHSHISRWWWRLGLNPAVWPHSPHS